MPSVIARTPTEAYVAVNPDEALPSGDERYVPLDAVRGIRNVAQSLTALIKIREEAFRTGLSAVLHDAVNKMITHVQKSLHEQDRYGLVIIADGLEKIPLRTLGERLTTHNVAFIHNGRHLKAPSCHLVYTLPLALFRSANIGQVFPEHPEIMPMVRARRRDRKAERQALNLMMEVVTRRVAPGVFARGVIKMLALEDAGTGQWRAYP